MGIGAIRERVRSSLWFLPSLFVIGAFVLASVATYLDDHAFRGATWMRFPGGPSSARSTLSTIASSMITFTGLVFSITILVLQLASQQFSPRVLRTFLHDRVSQSALGTFVATFTYALIVLRDITPNDVPTLTVSVALLLVLISLAMFVVYIDHIAHRISSSSIVDAVATETLETIRQRCRPLGESEDPDPERWVPAAAPIVEVPAPRSGVVVSLDTDRIARRAMRSDAIVELVPRVGDFVAEGMPLLRIYGDLAPSHGDPDWMASKVSFAKQRSMQRDVALGFRQLVDIAERALSPSINDPTTAVQAIDGLHALLRQLAGRSMPQGRHPDDEGRLRVVVHEPSWDEIVTLCVTEIRRTGATSIPVHRRMRAMLVDLVSIVSPERAAVVQGALRDLHEANERSVGTVQDRRLADQPDLQGLGA
ncbi:MAG: DUF2254 domain-containing protein [Planctomycetaceae bacterium]